MTHRSALKLAGILAAGTLLAAGASTIGTASAPPASDTDGALLPAGDYRTPELTRDDVIATGVAAGFDGVFVTEFVDGALPTAESTVVIGLHIVDDRWTQTVSFDGGFVEVVIEAAYRVVDATTIVGIEPCGETTYHYTVDGERISFDVVDNDCGDDILRLVRAVNFESAPFERVSSEASAGEPVELTFSNPYDSHHFPFGGSQYAAEVEELSGGSIRFTLTGNSREGDPENEAKMIADVQAGVVDIAIIGPRVFDRLGAERVAALTPPMLIDSYELERAAFTAGLPNRLLDDVDELGVVAVAVIPGPLQKPVGFDRTFRDADDFAGAVIPSGNSQLGVDTLTALGARPDPGQPVLDSPPGGGRFAGLSGYVFSVGAMWGRQVMAETEAATGNLNLFAVPFIVIVNRDVFDSLDASQRAALRDAGPSSVDDVIASTMSGQDEAVQSLCDAGFEFVTATDEELASVRAALDPVYAEIAADPDVAAYIEAVEQLKAELAAPPDTVTCTEPSTPSTPAAEVTELPEETSATTRTDVP